MMIKLGTSFSPDTEGIDAYNRMSLVLAEKISTILPNTSIYDPASVNENDFYDRAFVVLPEDLRARFNSTNDKRLLCYLIIQAKKRQLDFILLSPYMSSVNYSDKRIDDYVDIYIIGERQFIILMKWIKGEKRDES